MEDESMKIYVVENCKTGFSIILLMYIHAWVFLYRSSWNKSMYIQIRRHGIRLEKNIIPRRMLIRERNLDVKRDIWMNFGKGPFVGVFFTSSVIFYRILANFFFFYYPHCTFLCRIRFSPDIFFSLAGLVFFPSRDYSVITRPDSLFFFFFSVWNIKKKRNPAFFPTLFFFNSHRTLYTETVAEVSLFRRQKYGYLNQYDGKLFGNRCQVST